MSTDSNSLHLKYRPTHLKEIIGHEQHVARLQGMIKTGKIPNALLFLGPSSAGKTTLGRAFATDVLGGIPHPDYLETNVADKRTIEDMRELIGVSKLLPSGGKRRILLLDEMQQALSNPQAASVLLTPIESPPKTTTWILCSMDPEKFQSTKNGKAIANRCATFVLNPHSETELMAQLKRIVQGEEYEFFSKDLAKSLVDNCNGEMRTLANLIQATANYHEGKGYKPNDKLSTEDIQQVLRSTESDDDLTAVRFLVALHARKYHVAIKQALNVQDGFGFINKLMYLQQFVVNNFVLKGERHPKVWATNAGRELFKALDEVLAEEKGGDRLELHASILHHVAITRSKAAAFVVPESLLLSELAYACCFEG